jgi:hypothetical protein
MLSSSGGVPVRRSSEFSSFAGFNPPEDQEEQGKGLDECTLHRLGAELRRHYDRLVTSTPDEIIHLLQQLDADPTSEGTKH